MPHKSGHIKLDYTRTSSVPGAGGSSKLKGDATPRKYGKYIPPEPKKKAKIDVDKIRRDMLTKQATRVPSLKTSSLAQLDRLSNNIVPEGVTAGRPTPSQAPSQAPSPTSSARTFSGSMYPQEDEFFASGYRDPEQEEELVAGFYQAELDKINEEREARSADFTADFAADADAGAGVDPVTLAQEKDVPATAPDSALTTSEFLEQIRLSGQQPMDYSNIPQGVRDLTFAEQVGTYNPLRMNSRTGYNFAEHGLPETIQESWAAQQELLKMRQETARLKWKEGEYIPGPLDTKTGAATEKELRPGFW